LTIAGSHGLELQLAGSRLTEECCGEQSLIYKGKVGALAVELRDQVCTQGGWVEQKIFHVVFHWRDTSINYRPTMIQKAKEIMQKHGFQAIMTHYGVEARPPIGWVRDSL
jgi:trehalose-6-phosphatase